MRILGSGALWLADLGFGSGGGEVPFVFLDAPETLVSSSGMA
jgi:hypothetical protein